MLIGYARVSTNQQETDLQIDALKRAGVDQIVQEKTSSVGRRPELQKLLARLNPGDKVLVYRLDRLARSLKNLLEILEKLESAQAEFASLSEPIDTTTAAGRLMLQMLGAVAEFERTLIRERSIAGQVSAIERGVKFGRPKSLTEAQETEAYRDVQAGKTMSSTARKFGVSVIVIRRIIAEQQGKRLYKFPCPVLRKHSDHIAQMVN